MNNRKNFFDIKVAYIFQLRLYCLVLISSNNLLMSETHNLRYADYWRLPYENWNEDSWMNYLQKNYPDVSPRLARTYFVAELKVLINNLKPDSREHEKACTLKSRIKVSFTRSV
ncbi:hypothetical protein GLOIN_2v1780863 [Rhizophagus irregularis DAOM 181602=DAOM 197198]|nr:hypothetical protein GLOIN_2v1780863 [Rhizophagus irregularis DAOM 181602=DAOM 197198]